MRERMGLILKLACYVLAALLVYQLAKTALRLNPLSRVTIPALPTLASETNAPAVGASSNVLARSTTNASGTNVVAVKAAKESGTNGVASTGPKPGATNAPDADSKAPKVMVADAVISLSTNLPAPVKIEVAGTNLITISLPSNAIAGATVAASNMPPGVVVMGTNILMAVAAEKNNAVGTNAVGTNVSAKIKSTNAPTVGPVMATMNMNPAMMRGGGGGGKSDLPPEIKARVDRIYESELFGQIMRPQPMALQGIAGKSAFLRAPSGQTGLVKEGETLGEIKLLRIGINRVLVEQDGQKTELTIFNGYGGESLMPKDKETTK